MNRKAQEEIVGFVLIVILVAVIAVIFLGISLRNPSSTSIESQQIASFLSSASQVTTECEIPLTVKNNIGQLIVKCFEGDICADEESNRVSACETLENTLKEIMQASYLVNEESFTRYYNLTIYDSFNKPIIQPIFAGNEGNCPGRLLRNNRGFTQIGLSEEELTMNLEVCFNLEN